MTLEQMQKVGRKKAKPFYFDANRTVEKMCVAIEDLDQHTSDTWKAALDTILESGLLDEKNMSNEFISNLVYRTPPKDGDIVTHTHVDYSERRGHNQAVKTIREFITNMK